MAGDPLTPADQEALERIWSEVWEPARERGDTSTPFWEVMADFVRRALAAVPSLGHEAGEREALRSIATEAIAGIEQAFGDAVWLADNAGASAEQTDALKRELWRMSRAHRHQVALKARLAATPPGRSMPIPNTEETDR